MNGPRRITCKKGLIVSSLFSFRDYAFLALCPFFERGCFVERGGLRLFTRAAFFSPFLLLCAGVLAAFGVALDRLAPIQSVTISEAGARCLFRGLPEKTVP